MFKCSRKLTFVLADLLCSAKTTSPAYVGQFFGAAKFYIRNRLLPVTALKTTTSNLICCRFVERR